MKEITIHHLNLLLMYALCLATVTGIILQITMLSKWQGNYRFVTDCWFNHHFKLTDYVLTIN